MKRKTLVVIALAAAVVFAAASFSAAQTAFKVTFPFEAAGKKLPAGAYTIAGVKDDHLILRQEASGKETPVPFTQKLPTPEPPPLEPRLVFDEVGNFEPSYTEYFTVYILSEAWLSGTEGYLIHTTKGAHKKKVVKAEGGQR